MQDALATISAAIDKLVLLVLGIFLTPVLVDFRRALKDQEQRLLLADQRSRRLAGEQTIFDLGSTNTEPTHSQLAKDHSGHALNSIAGRIAVRVSTFTITETVRLWQPGNTEDSTTAISDILEVFHHPFDASSGSAVQCLMLEEVRAWVRESLDADAEGFGSTLHSLSSAAVATRMAGASGGHIHVNAVNQSHVKDGERASSR